MDLPASSRARQSPCVRCCAPRAVTTVHSASVRRTPPPRRAVLRCAVSIHRQDMRLHQRMQPQRTLNMCPPSDQQHSIHQAPAGFDHPPGHCTHAVLPCGAEGEDQAVYAYESHAYAPHACLFAQRCGPAGFRWAAEGAPCGCVWSGRWQSRSGWTSQPRVCTCPLCVHHNAGREHGGAEHVMLTLGACGGGWEGRGGGGVDEWRTSASSS